MLDTPAHFGILGFNFILAFRKMNHHRLYSLLALFVVTGQHSYSNAEARPSSLMSKEEALREFGILPKSVKQYYCFRYAYMLERLAQDLEQASEADLDNNLWMQHRMLRYLYMSSLHVPSELLRVLPDVHREIHMHSVDSAQLYAKAWLKTDSSNIQEQHDLCVTYGYNLYAKCLKYKRVGLLSQACLLHAIAIIQTEYVDAEMIERLRTHGVGSGKPQSVYAALFSRLSGLLYEQLPPHLGKKSRPSQAESPEVEAVLSYYKMTSAEKRFCLHYIINNSLVRASVAERCDDSAELEASMRTHALKNQLLVLDGIPDGVISALPREYQDCLVAYRAAIGKAVAADVDLKEAYQIFLKNFDIKKLKKGEETSSFFTFVFSSHMHIGDELYKELNIEEKFERYAEDNPERLEKMSVTEIEAVLLRLLITELRTKVKEEL